MVIFKLNVCEEDCKTLGKFFTFTHGGKIICVSCVSTAHSLDEATLSHVCWHEKPSHI